MHVIFRESHGLDETETPTDLGQSPADLVVLSFSDSDLGAFAAGWRRGGGPDGRLPTLRLANIAALKHPLSVDVYVEQMISSARLVVVRLLGGEAYWQYGVEQVAAAGEAAGVPVAFVPGDDQPDEGLVRRSTVSAATGHRLWRYLAEGGPDNLDAFFAGQTPRDLL